MKPADAPLNNRASLFKQTEPPLEAHISQAIKILRFAVCPYTLSPGWQNLAVDISFLVRGYNPPFMFERTQLFEGQMEYLIDEMIRYVADARYYGKIDEPLEGVVSSVALCLLSEFGDVGSIIRQCRTVEYGALSPTVGFRWRDGIRLTMNCSCEGAFNVIDDELEIEQQVSEAVKVSLIGEPLSSLIEAPGLPRDATIIGMRESYTDPGKFIVDLDGTDTTFDLRTGEVLRTGFREC